MYVLGVVPARAGSKGIPNKNKHLLNGNILINYALHEAARSKLSGLAISTDDLDFMKLPGAIARPSELAQDDTPMFPVIKHAVEYVENADGLRVDVVVILQPTSPLRTTKDINSALSMFEMYDNDSLISVYEGIHPIKSYDYEGIPFVIQDQPYNKHKHKCYTRNGAIFITRRDLLDKGKLIGEEPIFYIMNKINSIDIDDYDDLFLAEAVLKSRGELH